MEAAGLTGKTDRLERWQLASTSAPQTGSTYHIVAAADCGPQTRYQHELPGNILTVYAMGLCRGTVTNAGALILKGQSQGSSP